MPKFQFVGSITDYVLNDKELDNGNYKMSINFYDAQISWPPNTYPYFIGINIRKYYRKIN